MKRKEIDNKDRHLQAPAEANRDKHIDFLDVESESNEDTNTDNNNNDRAAPDVQKEWDDLKKDEDYNRE